MFYKKFDIRWSDVDANRHLANSAYVNFTSHVRMSFLESHNFGHFMMMKHNIGPVVFHEHFYYFKEIFPGQPIYVNLELAGISEDLIFFKFIHRFFNQEGKNLAYSDMQGAWINLKERKLTPAPEPLHKVIDTMPKSTSFKFLSKEDTRNQNIVPIDSSFSFEQNTTTL